MKSKEVIRTLNGGLYSVVRTTDDNTSINILDSKGDTLITFGSDYIVESLSKNYLLVSNSSAYPTDTSIYNMDTLEAEYSFPGSLTSNIIHEDQFSFCAIRRQDKRNTFMLFDTSSGSVELTKEIHTSYNFSISKSDKTGLCVESKDSAKSKDRQHLVYTKGKDILVSDAFTDITYFYKQSFKDYLDNDAIDDATDRIGGFAIQANDTFYMLDSNYNIIYTLSNAKEFKCTDILKTSRGLFTIMQTQDGKIYVYSSSDQNLKQVNLTAIDKAIGYSDNNYGLINDSGRERLYDLTANDFVPEDANVEVPEEYEAI